MCEPLRKKKKPISGIPGLDMFYIDDVKSAVTGFAREVDCMSSKNCTMMRCDIEELIIKWFPDVLE